MANILLTGGAGYIGSHTAVELLTSGHNVIIADDFSNSSENTIEKIRLLTGKRIKYYGIDIREAEKLATVFDENQIQVVVHMAGKKSVAESIKQPLEYYSNNVVSTISLLKVMQKYGVDKMIFSSSATVYGASNPVPFTEEMQRGECTNPYGNTKVMSEQIIEDCAKAFGMSAALLRYFNPIGAHPSGMIGESSDAIPENIMPYIVRVASGKLDTLTVYGNDYCTEDGTCIRDYIHVVDVAKAHVAAVGFILHHTGVQAINIGSGRPCSVERLIRAFERANRVHINRVYGERRSGDIPVCFSSVEKAKRLLGWQAEKGLDEMCRDSWRVETCSP